MGSDAIIQAEGLGKKYVIGHAVQRKRDRTLRDAVVRIGGGFVHTLKETARGRPLVVGEMTEEFWALKDVSFEVKRGEVLGIIGQNGAGKSTLLKILSRITDPSKGRVTIRGRVASLLEIGTGFHPELTGRENIFLNGAILGMTRAEVRQKFDEIVAFAGVERFLDTAVKRYSSGMYVRLAFAVAAHLEPEILVIDEVLAVGDAEFQKKCLGTMQTVASEGRTVLFVSHNLRAVERLCSRCLLMRAGTIEFAGPPPQACQQYTSATLQWDFATRLTKGARQAVGGVRITLLDVLDTAGSSVRTLAAGEPLRIRIRYVASERILAPVFGFALLTISGVRIFDTTSHDLSDEFDQIEGDGAIDLHIDGITLAPGRYICNLSIVDRSRDYCERLTEVPLLEIVDSGDLPRWRTYDQSSGVIYANARWSTAAVELEPGGLRPEKRRLASSPRATEAGKYQRPG
jgi:homopolymeric O-antigen transport system ATP-binding protein